MKVVYVVMARLSDRWEIAAMAAGTSPAAATAALHRDLEALYAATDEKPAGMSFVAWTATHVIEAPVPLEVAGEAE